MKAQIENKIENMTLEGMDAFVSLVNAIQDCDNKFELREMVHSESGAWYADFFVIGFDHHYMWVREIVKHSVSDKRLLLVEF